VHDVVVLLLYIFTASRQSSQALRQLWRLRNSKRWAVSAVPRSTVLLSLQEAFTDVLLWRSVQYLPGSNFTNTCFARHIRFHFSFRCSSAIIVRLTSVLVVVYFQACSRKTRHQPRVRHAVDNIVTEVAIPTDPTNDLTFGLFMQRTEEDVRRIIDDHRQRYE